MPVKAGIPAADIAAGMYAFSSVLAALMRRERTGEGATIDVTMLESLGEWMGFPALFTGTAARRRRAPGRITRPSCRTGRSRPPMGRRCS